MADSHVITCDPQPVSAGVLVKTVSSGSAGEHPDSWTQGLRNFIEQHIPCEKDREFISDLCVRHRIRSLQSLEDWHTMWDGHGRECPEPFGIRRALKRGIAAKRKEDASVPPSNEERAKKRRELMLIIIVSSVVTTFWIVFLLL